MGCFTGVGTKNNMNSLIAVCLFLLGVVAAEPGYYHHGYGHYGGYGHHGYYGKREAEPTAVAEADAEPGYYHHGYSHGYGYGHHGYYGKREAEADAEPGYYHHGYSHYGGYRHHGYYGKREALAEPGYYHDTLMDTVTVTMDTMAREKLRLSLNQDTIIMDMAIMEDMDTMDTTEREKLSLNPDTTIMVIGIMGDMDPWILWKERSCC